MFPLSDMNRIVSGILGWNIDTRKIESGLDKIRKTLNIQSLQSAIFDPESASEEQIRQMKDL